MTQIYRISIYTGGSHSRDMLVEAYSVDEAVKTAQRTCRGDERIAHWILPASTPNQGIRK